MRIGFDVSQTGQMKAGCGFFADALIQELAEHDTENEYVLYPTLGDGFFDPDWSTSTRRIERRNFSRGMAHKTHEEARSFWRCPPEDLDNVLASPEILHSNNFFCPSGLLEARLVYTLYDLGFLENPDWTTEENRICCFNGVFQASVRADRIIAISEHTREHFREIFPHYPANRISVAHPGSRFAGGGRTGRPKSLGGLAPEGYWLSVGTLEPRKNHKRLVEAYAELKAREGRVIPLVMAGAEGWLMDDFGNLVEELGLSEDVVRLGYVDDASLRWLYENCYALIYPSLFEGFGLPVLEAMSLGAPVIASKTTCLPEIVGDAGFLVDPEAATEIAVAMGALAGSRGKRNALAEKSLERSRRFSWQKTAELVLDGYREALAEPKYEKALD